MNRENVEALIKFIEEDSHELYMGKWFTVEPRIERAYGRGIDCFAHLQGPECATACCIAGFEQMRCADRSGQSAMEFAEKSLGLTDEQAEKLFTPDSLAIRRYRNISKEIDLWGDCEYPIVTQDKALAIKALRRALELWG